MMTCRRPWSDAIYTTARVSIRTYIKKHLNSRSQSPGGTVLGTHDRNIGFGALWWALSVFFTPARPTHVSEGNGVRTGASGRGSNCGSGPMPLHRFTDGKSSRWFVGGAAPPTAYN